MENEPSISKVTVEYYDPSGIFPLISRQFQSHLPLRDLHWKSPTRPLRSINYLHVDLAAARDADRPDSRHGTPGLDHGSPAPTPGERRHQIPGLRRTPYLKVYLLRCDDSETYKSTARKNLREWLKTHTPASQSSSSRNSQENHDAFEWLILHVVLPNTGAASQPRASGSSSRSENVTAEKSGSSSKLLGRSSSTILEKIKADFNVSSKSAPDRVVQLRLHSSELSADSIPQRMSSTVQDYQESAQERANAWQDVVNKLKTLILLSFSLRVSQYEEDIRERDAQRALPGWNFCTFFMLKEGLARGFESVGLVDDALIGYDELSLGLQNAMNEGDEDGMTTRSDSFLRYTKEMKDILLKCLTSDSAPEVFWKSGTKIVSTARKDYRNLIVNSNVSLFDFQCYIFARQMSILLRMGILHSSEKASQQTEASTGDADNLTPLSELCQRAASFISTASRTLQEELLQAAVAQGIEAPLFLVENITASFAYAVAEQVLEATDLPALLHAQVATTTPNLHQNMDRLQHPIRRSSLPSRTPPPQQAPDSPIAMLKRLGDKLSLQQGESELKVMAASDLGILAGNRADLILLQRQIAERIACKKSWRTGLSRLQGSVIGKYYSYADIDLDENPHDVKDGRVSTSDMSEGSTEPDTRGILYSNLLDALSSPDKFSACYEKLTNLALTQCVIASRVNTVERLVADLAVIKFDSGDPATAASYLGRVVPSFADHNWGLIETGLVKIHAQCLRKLNQKDDYVRMTLSILAKAAARQKALLQVRVGSRLWRPRAGLDEGDPEAEGILADLLSVSQELPCDVIVPISDFFVDISVDPYIEHFEEKDGFSLDLKLCYLLNEVLIVDVVRMKFKCIDPPFREFWLECPGLVTLNPGLNRIKLEAEVTCSGLFTIEKIVIKSKKINFEAEVKRSQALSIARESMQLTPDEGSFLTRLPQIHCYPAGRALALEIKASKEIYIGRPRVMEIELRTGRNKVEKGQFSLRAASAGLRLMTADATVSDEEVTLAKGKAPGMFELANLDAESSITILVPYDLESNLPRITVGLDFAYTTPAGMFQYLSNPTIVTDLALDVSVHDLFRTDLLYSRFQIRASRGIPLLIQSVELGESDRYTVEAPPCKFTPMLVLPKQDGTIVYKIKPKEQKEIKRESIKEEKPLQLTVAYLLLSEVASAAVEESLLRALADSDFGFLRRALQQALAKPFQHLSQEKLEEVALLNEFHLPSYEDLGWNELLDGLKPRLRQELEAWLKKWHVENQVILVSPLTDADDATSQHQIHSVRISVPLPRLHILHTAKISLLRPAAFLSQGSIIPAIISVAQTRRWESPPMIASMTSSSADDPLDFFLEVDAPPDTWLIGGQRRTGFRASEGEEKIFQLILIPLRTGRLLLPEVIVRLTGKAAEELRCETDYRSLGQTVVVVADIRSTTVGLNEAANGTELVLMASERRTKP